MDAFGGQRIFRDDRITNAFHSGGAFQFIQDHVAVTRQHRFPVMTGPEIRCVNQDVQRFATVRCHFGFANRGSTNVRGWVGSRLTLFVDVVEFFFGIFGEHKVVMQQLFVPPVQSQIQNHAAAGGFVAIGLFKLGRLRCTAE